MNYEALIIEKKKQSLTLVQFAVLDDNLNNTDMLASLVTSAFISFSSQSEKVSSQ